MVAGANVSRDGLGGLFTWDENSTADDDNEMVICPTQSSGAGRWGKIAVGQIGQIGPAGEQGPTGDKGPTGDTGSPGDFETEDLPSNLAMRLSLPSGQKVAAFSEGGSVGFGDPYADGDVNPHAGDGITRVVSVRSSVGAPLFLGLTDRPNDEAGGPVGRSMMSVEAYRMANDLGYRDMGGLRVISQGSSIGRWGGRVALIGRADGFSTVENFHELFSIYNASQSAGAGSAHAYLGIAALSGVATANRTGVAPTTSLLTMAGSTGATIEMTSGANTGGNAVGGQTLGELLFVPNYNGGGDKRAARIMAITEGADAGNIGAIMLLQVKASGGALLDNLTLSATGTTPAATFAGRWACNGASPQGPVTMNSPSPATTNLAASDLDSAIALVNELKAKYDTQQALITQMRAALVANGIGTA